ncbi:hypothetical protein Tco_1104309 [Tanacetum coccineum]
MPKCNNDRPSYLQAKEQIVALVSTEVGAIRGTAHTTAFPKIFAISTNEQTSLSQPTSVVRNTLGKEPVPQNPGSAPREVQQEKLKAVKARLNFEEASHHSESGTPIRRRDLKERLRQRYIRGKSGSLEPKRGRSESPKKKGLERKAVFKRLEKGVFHRLEDKGRSISVHSDDSRRYHSSRRDTESCHQSSHLRATESVSERYYNKRASSRRMEELSESEGSAGGEVAASNRERKKSFPSWKQQKAGQKQNFKKGSFRNQQRPERKQVRFTLLTKTPKEILALDKGKFKTAMPMTTPVEKKEMLANSANFMRKKAIVLNKGSQPEQRKRAAQSGKERRNLRERQSTSHPNDEDEGTEGPMIIEEEIRGHCIHRMYVDGESASEILYEHCFNRLRLEIKNQLVSVTTPLIGFSGEIIWPIGQIQLLVRIRDEEHSAAAWMNFVVLRSPSPYNRIIRRPGIRKLQAVPSTAHEMLKLPVEGGVITLKSSRLVLLECALVSGPEEALRISNQWGRKGSRWQ